MATHTTNQPDQGRMQDQTQRATGAPGAQSAQSTQNAPNTQSSQGAQSAQSAQTTGTPSDREQQMPTSRERGREGGRGIARRQPASGISPWNGGFTNPWSLMQQIQNEMDRVFEDFGFGRGFFSPSSLGTSAGSRGLAARSPAADLWSPQLDVFRRGDDLVVRADLPGLSKDDVQVEVENDVLTIRGERKHEAQEDREGLLWNERSYGAFERSIPLPEGTDGERAQASFRDGVLEVTLPAPKQQERRSRRIEIR